jgi:hypothetical protein
LSLEAQSLTIGKPFGKPAQRRHEIAAQLLVQFDRTDEQAPAPKRLKG